MLIFVGVCCGTIGASMGIGGGIILVPILVLAFSFGQKSAQGMSLAVIVPMALMAAFRYYRNPDIEINLWYVFFLSIGAIVGAVLGSKIAASLPAETLRKIFAVVLVVAAIKMLFFSSPKKPVELDDHSVDAPISEESS